VRQHAPDDVWHPAMARCPATLSKFRESGMPNGTAFSADSPRPVRVGAKAPVPRPWGFGGAPRGTAVPLSSGRGVLGDRSPARFLWYRQRHLSFQRKVGLRERVLRTILTTDIPALRTMQISLTAARGGTFDRAKVPKARWGVANAPQTPVARSLGAKTCGFLPCRGRQHPSFPCGGRGTRDFAPAGAGRGLSAESAAAQGIHSPLNLDRATRRRGRVPWLGGKRHQAGAAALPAVPKRRAGGLRRVPGALSNPKGQGSRVLYPL